MNQCKIQKQNQAKKLRVTSDAIVKAEKRKLYRQGNTVKEAKN